MRKLALLPLLLVLPLLGQFFPYPHAFRPSVAGVLATFSTNHIAESSSDGKLTFPNTTTAGSLYLAAWQSDTTGTDISGGCIDTESNSWSLVRRIIADNSALFQGEVWKAVNAKGGSKAQVTCTLGAAALYGHMYLIEVLKNGGAAPDVITSIGVKENITNIGPLTSTLASALFFASVYPGDGSSAACTGSPSGTFSVFETANGNSKGDIQGATLGAANNYTAQSCGSTLFFSTHVGLVIQ